MLDTDANPVVNQPLKRLIQALQAPRGAQQEAALAALGDMESTASGSTSKANGSLAPAALLPCGGSSDGPGIPDPASSD